MECTLKFRVALRLHVVPHLVPDTLLLQDISYQTYVNGVVASLHQSKKGFWPLFPLSTKVCKIENFKQAKDEVGILTSFKFREDSIQRHDPQGKLKEHFAAGWLHLELLL